MKCGETPNSRLHGPCSTATTNGGRYRRRLTLPWLTPTASRVSTIHILSTFNHKSHPNAAEVCLARFDELKSFGLEAITRKHDPYWDIPLNENVPQPVIELANPDEAKASSVAGTFSFEGIGNAVTRASNTGLN